MDSIQWPIAPTLDKAKRKRKTSDGPPSSSELESNLQGLSTRQISSNSFNSNISSISGIEDLRGEDEYNSGTSELTTTRSNFNRENLKRRSSFSSTDFDLIEEESQEPSSSELEPIRYNIGGGNFRIDSSPPSITINRSNIPPPLNTNGLIKYSRKKCILIIGMILISFLILLTFYAAIQRNNHQSTDIDVADVPLEDKNITKTNKDGNTKAPFGHWFVGLLLFIGIVIVLVVLIKRIREYRFKQNHVLMVRGDNELHTLMEQAREQWRKGHFGGQEGSASPHLVPNAQQRAWVAKTLKNNSEKDEIDFVV